MAENAPRHRYEDIRIGENNVVHLGDQRVTNTKEINIQTAYLFLREELDLPTLKIANAIHSTHLQQARSHNSSLIGKPTPRADVQSSDTHQPECVQDMLYRGRAPFKIFGAQGGLQRLTRQIPEWAHSLAWLRQLSPQTVSDVHRQTSCSVACGDSPNSSSQDLVPQHVEPASSALFQPGQEFMALIAFVLSCLVGRNASQQEMSAFLTKCQRDPFLPLLTAALAFGIARYIQTARVLNNPSCLDELKVTLEDAYGVRNLVSMSICSDFSIFRSFLETHYRKAGRKTGEMLIRADQFHLMLGSRRGALIDANNWEVEAGANIVNSLYVVTEDQKCLLCKNTLLVSKIGDLHCSKCNGFFRDYDVLRPQNFRRQGGLNEARISSQQTTPTNYRTIELSDYVEYLDDTQIELEGLRHIDIRISPARRHAPSSNIGRAQRMGTAYHEAVAETAAQTSRSKYDSKDRLPEMVVTADTGYTRHLHASSNELGGRKDKRRTSRVKLESQQQVAGEGLEVAQLSQFEKRQSKVKSILKPARRTPFPEDSDFHREGVAPIGRGGRSGIPPGARWTKISRVLVSPEVLELTKERFEEDEDYVIVLRVLDKKEIQLLADRTRELREAAHRVWDNDWPELSATDELSPEVHVLGRQISPIQPATNEDVMPDSVDPGEEFIHEFAL